MKGEPTRFIRGHSTRLSPHEYLVDDESGCWVWQRSRTTTGYGLLSKDGKMYKAHRWHYEKANGPIPEGLHLDHLCRNPLCVNPEHLEPVTQAENVRRGRAAKLDAEKVAEIRALATEGWRQKDIAAAYGVAAGYVSHLVCGLNWRAA